MARARKRREGVEERCRGGRVRRGCGGEERRCRGKHEGSEGWEGKVVEMKECKREVRDVGRWGRVKGRGRLQVGGEGMKMRCRGRSDGREGKVRRR